VKPTFSRVRNSEADSSSACHRTTPRTTTIKSAS